jgi:UDP-galactopyranose mutase
MVKRILIVGAGLFGAVCGRELTDAGYPCLVIERRNHIGGNCFSAYEPEAACHRHVYGPHIFHTDKDKVWRYINRFTSFNHFSYRPKVWYQDNLYSFPINLFTLYQLFGIRTPKEAEDYFEKVRRPTADPANLEDWCLSQIGPDLYRIFIEGYTQKQWHRHPSLLPAGIIKRLPVRLHFDDNYFMHPHQGIPIGGYTSLFTKLLAGIPLETEADFLRDKERWMRKHDLVIYTGAIDEFFSFALGPLEYRALRFETELINSPDFQGTAAINYTEAEIPFTRIVEHKHFDISFDAPKTIITREFPEDWSPGATPYYPVNTSENQERLQRYQQFAEIEAPNVIFGGRLGEYRYFDMDQVIESALNLSQTIIRDHPISAGISFLPSEYELDCLQADFGSFRRPSQ